MQDEAEARERRVQQRRETWRIEPLSAELLPPEGITERFIELERLRRIAFALAGIDYPEDPTPKSERRRWPLERIG